MPPIGYCPAVGFGDRHELATPSCCAHVAGDRYAFDPVVPPSSPWQLHRLSPAGPPRTPTMRCKTRCCQRTAALGSRSGTVPPSAVGCTASWSTHPGTGCVGPKHPTAPLEDVYPVADRTAVETVIAVQRALMRLPVEQRAAVVAGLFDHYRPDAGRGRGHRQKPLRPGAGRLTRLWAGSTPGVNIRRGPVAGPSYRSTGSPLPHIWLLPPGMTDTGADECGRQDPDKHSADADPPLKPGELLADLQSRWRTTQPPPIRSQGPPEPTEISKSARVEPGTPRSIAAMGADPLGEPAAHPSGRRQHHFGGAGPARPGCLPAPLHAARPHVHPVRMMPAHGGLCAVAAAISVGAGDAPPPPGTADNRTSITGVKTCPR